MIFNLRDIEKSIKVAITGAIHVGAFLGEELSDYRSLGLDNTILFEPQEKLYHMTKFKCWPTERVFNVALGSEDKTVDMFISDRAGGVHGGAGASSSILQPKKHLAEHPEVTFPKKEKITVKRFDKFIEENEIDIKYHNLLNIDVQGYELEVLKGIGEHLNQIDIVIVEVNRDETYKDCALIEEVDGHLARFNFTRIAVVWQSQSWGDALYVRGKKND
jgi:FkbM family methyltransferase|tara:strand:- start:671 stop:1324 length:654 start_codon:yes stop_codon:yes gene_type:complete